MKRLQLQPVSPGICRVLADSGLHVGNLKRIGGFWKFKAVGYDASGQLIPGGGLLTDHHNTIFKTPDIDEISRIFC